MLFFWAKTLTGLGVSFRCRPAGLSGVVIIAHKERPCAFNIFSSTGSENSDEPKKTICLDMLTL